MGAKGPLGVGADGGAQGHEVERNLAEAGLERLDGASRSGLPCHAHFATAAAAQLEIVHQVGDDEQPAAVVDCEVGKGPPVEAGGVEAPSAVSDERDQPSVGELQGDPDVGGGPAVADGVGTGFLNAEYDIVDELALRAVAAQVVAQALAGAQQVGAFRRDPELQPRRRGLGRCP